MNAICHFVFSLGSSLLGITLRKTPEELGFLPRFYRFGRPTMSNLESGTKNCTTRWQRKIQNLLSFAFGSPHATGFIVYKFPLQYKPFIRTVQLETYMYNADLQLPWIGRIWLTSIFHESVLRVINAGAVLLCKLCSTESRFDFGVYMMCAMCL